MRHFGNFISSYVDYTRHQEASTKIHKWVAISIIAAALERKVVLNRGFYLLFPNLYTFIIGASGIVRKSTSTGIGVDLLRNLENFRMMSERLTAASLIQQLERSGDIYKANGYDTRQSAIFCYASELSVFLKEVFGSISELLTTFYDCQPNDATKPWVYETKGEGQVKIFGPCLNILGASTPTWLRECIPADQMEGGFSSRVIFVVETDPPSKFVAWPEVDKATNEMRPKLIETLAHIHTLVGEFKPTEESKVWFSAWYEKHMRGLISRTDARFSGYYGRKGDLLLKVAMVFSVAESDELLLKPEHLEQASNALDELEKSMFDAFGSVGKNEFSAETHSVWNTIRREVAIPHSKLLGIYWRDLGHAEMLKITETLHRMNKIRAETVGTEIVYTAIGGTRATAL